MRALVTVFILASAVAAAQEEFPAPPMVQADIVDERQGQVLQPPAIANQPLDPTLQPQPLPSRPAGTLTPQAPSAPQQPVQGWQQPGANSSVGVVQEQKPTVNPRLVRIGMSALIGAGVGTATAIAGGFLGGEFMRPGITSIGNIYTGGAIGFAIGAPIGVLISGAIFKSDAPWYAAVIGDVLGVALGIGCVALAGPDAVSTTFILPLVGSILGAEVASSDEPTVAPVVTLLPKDGGAIAGVQGRF